jgi:hypothetical protein
VNSNGAARLDAATVPVVERSWEADLPRGQGVGLQRSLMFGNLRVRLNAPSVMGRAGTAPGVTYGKHPASFQTLSTNSPTISLPDWLAFSILLLNRASGREGEALLSY